MPGGKPANIERWYQKNSSCEKSFFKKEWGCLVCRKMSSWWLNDYLWVNTRVALFSRTTPFPWMEAGLHLQICGADWSPSPASACLLTMSGPRWKINILYSQGGGKGWKTGLPARPRSWDAGVSGCKEVVKNFECWAEQVEWGAEMLQLSRSYGGSLNLSFLIWKMGILMRASL